MTAARHARVENLREERKHHLSSPRAHGPMASLERLQAVGDAGPIELLMEVLTAWWDPRCTRPGCHSRHDAPSASRFARYWSTCAAGPPKPASQVAHTAASTGPPAVVYG